MTEVSAKRLLDLVIWITEKYWDYSLLDICTGILETDKLTAEELLKCLTPEANAQLSQELRKKYINRPYLEKLIKHYETFLNLNKKARGTSSEPL